MIRVVLTLPAGFVLLTACTSTECLQRGGIQVCYESVGGSTSPRSRVFVDGKRYGSALEFRSCDLEPVRTPRALLCQTGAQFHFIFRAPDGSPRSLTHQRPTGFISKWNPEGSWYIIIWPVDNLRSELVLYGTGGRVHTHRVEGRSAGYEIAAVSPDGKLALLCHRDGTRTTVRSHGVPYESTAPTFRVRLLADGSERPLELRLTDLERCADKSAGHDFGEDFRWIEQPGGGFRAEFQDGAVLLKNGGIVFPGRKVPRGFWDQFSCGPT